MSGPSSTRQALFESNRLDDAQRVQTALSLDPENLMRCDTSVTSRLDRVTDVSAPLGTSACSRRIRGTDEIGADRQSGG